MDKEKLNQEANKYFETKREEVNKVNSSPLKIWQTKRVLCRKCMRMVAKNMEMGIPQENERKENYCTYCQKRLETIWK